MTGLSTSDTLLPLRSDNSAFGRDLIVDNVRGNDAQNDRGLVPGPATYGPYRSVTRALAGAQSGDRIVLTNTGQPYRECLSLVGPKHSGIASKPFEIVGNGATLDGTTAPTANQWKPLAEDVWALRNSPPAYAILTREGKLLNRSANSSGDLTALQPMEWKRVSGTVYLRCESNRGPMDYALEVTDQTTGITLYDVRDVVIRDLTIRGYRIDGIQANDSARDVVIMNVATRQNGRSGITVAGSCEVTIGATLSEQNGETQLRVEDQALVRLGKVDLVESQVPATLTLNRGRIEQLPAPDQ